MMQQYMQIKQQHKNHILFFRLGDFYEMFFDDALLVSRELELTLTGRDCGQEERAPMCGVPYHSCEAYIARLIKKGYKVAICEQTEDPSAAKGLVRREVIRVVTPGTVLESNMLEEGNNNYIASIYYEAPHYGVAFADVSTGAVHVTELLDNPDIRLQNELGRFSPSEVVFNSAFVDKKEIAAFMRERLQCSADLLEDSAYQREACAARIEAQFSASLGELGLQQQPYAVCALGALLGYLIQTQQKGLETLTELDLYSDNQYMNLNYTACSNLELTRTMRSKEKRGSLLWVLDRTKTAMGKRMLRAFIEKPLINPLQIQKRLNAVSELYENPILLDGVAAALGGVFDLERLISRIVYGSATPRELKSLEYTAQRLPGVREQLSGVGAQLLVQIYQQIDPLEDLCQQIHRAIKEEPPATLKEGGVIQPGYSSELDELRGIITNSKQYIADIEQQERERTGIKNLKIGYNRVFGYYIEVTKSNLEMVPDSYIRKQTLANCERYITQELKELEARVLGASDRAVILEAQLYEELRGMVASQLHRVQATANAIARLDVFASFAAVAIANHYTCPAVDLSGRIVIKEGRHPVVEQMLTDVPFVSNDVELNMEQELIAVITGPNMAGKSTYMRQTALIVIMAQMGCFVPARSATIGVVDGIYTRVGASDDLATGQSTFMVEMSELADMLRNATSRSLLILDEIGRGTSTFDGMSIARAVIEHIADRKKLGAKTLFATHYHELTEMEETIDCVKNYNVAVKRRGDEVIFLRRIVRGGADDSYGIYVSKLAGIPSTIVHRATQILHSLEQGENPTAARTRHRPKEPAAGQVMLVQADDSELVRRLREVDPNTLTPIQAMNLLCELKNLV